MEKQIIRRCKRFEHQIGRHNLDKHRRTTHPRSAWDWRLQNSPQANTSEVRYVAKLVFSSGCRALLNPRFLDRSVLLMCFDCGCNCHFLSACSVLFLSGTFSCLPNLAWRQSLFAARHVRLKFSCDFLTNSISRLHCIQHVVPVIGILWAGLNFFDVIEIVLLLVSSCPRVSELWLSNDHLMSIAEPLQHRPMEYANATKPDCLSTAVLSVLCFRFLV
jgi:hypothetical protein